MAIFAVERSHIQADALGVTITALCNRAFPLGQVVMLHRRVRIMAIHTLRRGRTGRVVRACQPLVVLLVMLDEIATSGYSFAGGTSDVAIPAKGRTCVNRYIVGIGACRVRASRTVAGFTGNSRINPS